MSTPHLQTGFSRPIRWVLCLTVAFVAPIITTAATDAATQPARPGPGGREPGSALKMLQERLDKLDLSADQKKQIKEILADTQTQMREAMQGARNATPEERRQKLQPIVQQMREKIGGVLTDEQKQKLREDMASLQAKGGPSNPMTRARENLDKLGLSEDQKTKATAVLDDAQQKMSDIREQLQNGNGDAQQVREKMQGIREDVHSKLAEILTKDQQVKLQELMGSEGGPGSDGQQRPASRPQSNK